MALGSNTNLTEMSTRNPLLGCKGGRCVGLTNLPPSCADCLRILRGCTGKGLESLAPTDMPLSCPDMRLVSASNEAGRSDESDPLAVDMSGPLVWIEGEKTEKTSEWLNRDVGNIRGGSRRQQGQTKARTQLRTVARALGAWWQAPLRRPSWLARWLCAYPWVALGFAGIVVPCSQTRFEEVWVLSRQQLFPPFGAPGLLQLLEKSRVYLQRRQGLKKSQFLLLQHYTGSSGQPSLCNIPTERQLGNRSSGQALLLALGILL